jgi:branched-chain amino acid aminotransferase
MYYNNDTEIYLNGEFIKAVDARGDLYSQSLHYGYSVFEGIRSYKTISGATKIFKEKEHYDRLKRSAQAVNMPYTWSSEELIKASYILLERNQLQDAYIRPLVFAPPNMTFNPNKESFIMIAVWKMEPFLGEKLLSVMTSSFQRPNPGGFIMEAKASGHYVNSIMASQEAKSKGFDEALLLDINGFVAEAPGANIFVEKEGVLYTPKKGNILPGITRATVMEICEQSGITVVEKQIKPEELKAADGAFFCGTAAEVIGIEKLDNRNFLRPWNETLGATLQKAYKSLVTEKESSPALALA